MSSKNTDPLASGGWVRTFVANTFTHMGGWVGVGATVVSGVIIAYALNRLSTMG